MAAFAVQAVRVYSQEVVLHHLSDFGRMYYAVIDWQQGGGLYRANAASPLALPNGSTIEMINVASPAWHIVVWPFTTLPPAWAFLAWLLVNLGAWLLSVRICIREWGLAVDRRWRPVIVLALLASPLVAGAFHTGQYTSLLMLPATLAWNAARRERWGRAGLLLGMVAVHKPFVFVFAAWMFWHRLWKGAWSCLAAVAATALVGAAAFGSQSYVEWRTALEGTSRWTWLYLNGSVWAPWARTFGPSPAFAFVDVAQLVLLPGLVCAAVIGATSWWHLRHRHPRLDWEWSTLWLSALLLSPLGWTYYLWFGAGPLGAVLCFWATSDDRYRATVALGAAAILPLATVTLGQPSVIASLTIGSLYTWILVLWWSLLLRDRRRLATGSI